MYDVVALRRALKKIPVGYTVQMDVFGKISIYDRGGRYRGYIDTKYATFKEGHVTFTKYQKSIIRLCVAFLVSYAVARWYVL